MAVDPVANNPDLEEALRKSGVESDAVVSEETGPVYKVLGDSKIPVSKNLGKLWQSRIQQGQTAKADIETCWSEAIRYYENDQLGHRNTSNTKGAGNTRFSRKISNNWTETENIVFSNVTTMLPMLYAKNPAVEITPLNPANQDFATCCQRLINSLFSMKIAPGVGLKAKARRGVLWTLLANSAYMKIGYTLKQDSSEAAFEELKTISAKYGEKDLKACDIKELEGQLAALEEKTSILNPQGPSVTIISPFRLVIDPTSIEPDHSDASWIAEQDYLQTDYVNAVYATKKDGVNVSIYEPSHILKAGTTAGDGVQDDVNNFSLFNKDPDQEAKNYGYTSTAQYKKACYTKVWWVWDKTTRRLFLYADNYWSWPLWVWDDPLKLLEFFPYKHLWFHETVEGSQPKGEVTYYLDQQDAVNDINSDFARARSWARNNVFYDKNKISQAAVEEVLKGPDGTARGIDVPDGQKITDCIFSFVPPNMQHPEIFQQQIEQKFSAINRITGINDAQRGAQFKTNTTNQAVSAYQQNIEIRTDEKVDLIEDWIGQVAWALLQVCSRYMTVEEVTAIVGEAVGQAWTQITDPADLRTKLNLTVVGGSSEKPTSKNKKEAALKMTQVLGQFASGVPAIAMVAIKVLERAFKDDMTITKEDWDMLHESMQQNMQKAGAGPGGQPGAAGPDLPDDPNQLQEMIAQLPPEAKAHLQQLIQSGVPPQDALKQIAGAQSAAPQPTA